MSEIITGDVRDVLPTLESESVQMCVTSPPYWGLRDYGTAEWEGGDANCEHNPKQKPRSTRPSGALTGGTKTVDEGTVQRDCYCGARRIDKQLGLEQTPEEYVANMVAVFSEVRRVLKDDGTCWVNMGDGYAQNEIRNRNGDGNIQRPCRKGVAQTGRKQSHGLKPKDLIGMPWRLAFALQADGWYLRQDIIWHKPNPMPESVTDRCTKAHEYIFLLSKSPRYYFDADAIREPHSQAEKDGKENIGDWKSVGERVKHGDDPTMRTRPGSRHPNYYGHALGRNKRSVWTVPSQAYSDAHFATFPEKLIEPCILAGSRPGDVVIDPFFGSGTTGQVCERLGREWLGVELNEEYAGMARRRTSQRGLVF